MTMSMQGSSTARRRLRQLGIIPGILPTGARNVITDVAGVCVGHVTLIEEDAIRTGVTAILPHGGNLYREKVPAGLAVGNGYGKLMGSTQISELGEIETPIVLTNTLAVPRAADALLDWTLRQPGNEEVRSVNMVVGETNDGYLNDIRRRIITVDHVLQALAAAQGGLVGEGAVGAGTGTVAFGWKGGIGTSSRRLPPNLGGDTVGGDTVSDYTVGDYTVGVLVQSNYGGILQVAGDPIGQRLGQYYLQEKLDTHTADGSIMIIVATDAPLSDRNLTRLAGRALAGLARTGSAMSNGSGDYALAFSTAEDIRRRPRGNGHLHLSQEIANEQMSPLFLAAIEATEEAIYNSLCMATRMQGFRGRVVEALPVAQLRNTLKVP